MRTKTSFIKVKEEVDLLGCGVYKITNLETKKFYIGSTCRNFKSRVYEHNALIKKENISNNRLVNSYLSHGLEKFYFEVLEYVEKDTDTSLRVKTLQREQYYLDTLLFAQEYLNTNDQRFVELGYNTNPLATSTFGRKHREDSKELMRQKVVSEEQKEYLRRKAILQNESYTLEEREDQKEKGKQTKIKNGTYRKPMSKESALSNSRNSRGEKNGMFGKSGILNPKSKPLVQLDPITNEIVNFYGSLQELERVFKPSINCSDTRRLGSDYISDSCKLNTISFDFKWKFITKEEYKELESKKYEN